MSKVFISKNNEELQDTTIDILKKYEECDNKPRITYGKTSTRDKIQNNKK